MVSRETDVIGGIGCSDMIQVYSLLLFQQSEQMYFITQLSLSADRQLRGDWLAPAAAAAADRRISRDWRV